MKEKFPQPQESPEKESIQPDQADIDELFTKLVQYENAGTELHRIMYKLLAKEDLGLTIQGIEAGNEEVDGIQRDIDVETEADEQRGEIYLYIGVHDRFERSSGKTLHFKKNYTLKASESVLGLFREKQEQEKLEGEKEASNYEAQVREAMAVFRPYAQKHLDEKLSVKEWETDTNVMRELIGISFPVDGSWTISETGNADAPRLRVTFYNAEGGVHDIYEFDAR